MPIARAEGRDLHSAPTVLELRVLFPGMQSASAASSSEYRRRVSPVSRIVVVIDRARVRFRIARSSAALRNVVLYMRYENVRMIRARHRRTVRS